MIAVAVAAAAVGATIGSVVVPDPSVSPGSASASPAQTRASAGTWGSSGPVALAIPSETRARFVRALDQHRAPVLEQHLAESDGSRAGQAAVATRASAEEHVGEGPGFVALAPPSDAEHGGSLTVVLLVARTGPAGWRASRTAVGADLKPYSQGLALARSVLTAGVPASTVARYSGHAPTRLEVILGAGDRWDALVIFSN